MGCRSKFPPFFFGPARLVHLPAVRDTQAVSRNEKLSATLREAREHIAALRGWYAPDAGPGTNLFARVGFGAGVEVAVRDFLDAVPALLDTPSDRALRERMEHIQKASSGVERHRHAILQGYVEKLRTRMQELVGAQVDPERLLQEAALLVDRSDIQEELVRLDTHVKHFLSLLDQRGEVGKKLDFLLQELNREANTLLSKTSGVAGDGLHLEGKVSCVDGEAECDTGRAPQNADGDRLAHHLADDAAALPAERLQRAELTHPARHRRHRQQAGQQERRDEDSEREPLAEVVGQA